jgi:hypothetical protein
MAIFVSYARRDRPKVQHLTGRIRQLGRETWLDESLKGGQAWWDEILGQIRRCEALLIAVSQTALQSQACTFERQYAAALRKPLLPVLVEPVAKNLLPAELTVLHVVDYVQPGEAAAYALAGAVTGLPAAGPLPDPLPHPPPVPLSYLTNLSHRVSAPTLGLEEQLDLVSRLETRLQTADPEECDGARELLNRLARRGDLFAQTEGRINRALQQQQVRSRPRQHEPFPDATPEHQPPWWKRKKTLFWVGAILIVIFFFGMVSECVGGGCFYDVYGNYVCS